MPDKTRVSSGAYVIRNRHTLTVLHIETATATSDYSRVLAFEQDENLYRDNQVWWIEPLPDPEGDEEGELYSITNSACGKYLDEEGSGRVCAAKPHGAPWQIWRIQRVESGDEGDSYTIVGTRNGGVIGIKTPVTDTKASAADLKAPATNSKKPATDLKKPVTDSKKPATDSKNSAVDTQDEKAVSKPATDSKNSAVSAQDEKAVSKPGTLCHTQQYIPDHDQHCWEFVIPIVSFPVGWFQIQNAGSGDLLCHKYPYKPPILWPPPTTACPSQHLECWGTQWTLAKVETITPGYVYTTGKNTWYIVNRLTGGRLQNRNQAVGVGQVVAWTRDWGNHASSLWKLELDPACNWTIMNHRTSLLLEQTKVPRGGGGVEADCINKRFNLGVRNRSWVFTQPLLEKNDEVRVYLQGSRVGNDSKPFLVPKGLIFTEV